jgi:hypothetical protein
MITPKLGNNLAKNYLFLAGAFLTAGFLAGDVAFLAGAFLTTIFTKRL